MMSIQTKAKKNLKKQWVPEKPISTEKLEVSLERNLPVVCVE